MRVQARIPTSADAHKNLRGKGVAYEGYSNQTSPSPQDVRGRVFRFTSTCHQ